MFGDYNRKFFVVTVDRHILTLYNDRKRLVYKGYKLDEGLKF